MVHKIGDLEINLETLRKEVKSGQDMIRRAQTQINNSNAELTDLRLEVTNLKKAKAKMTEKPKEQGILGYHLLEASLFHKLQRELADDSFKFALVYLEKYFYIKGWTCSKIELRPLRRPSRRT